MKLKFILIAILTICFSACVFTACKHTHEYGEWQVHKEATFTEEGEERRYCLKCSEYESNTLEKLVYPYYITIDVNGETTQLGVPDSGEYVIEKPVLEGYEFVKWVDEQGDDFAESGTIEESKSITAQFNVLGTESFETLKKRIDLGVKDINIVSDIEISETLYVYNDVNIYTESKVSVKRAENLLGDLFVVGENANGDSPILQNRTVSVKLSVKGEGELVFDGNKGVVSDEVKGSAFYITNSSTLDMYEGVIIKNFKKVDNERIVSDFGEIWDSASDAGGSAFMITYGTVNMYGGLITENESSLSESDSTSAYGGAIYNRSAFNMFGGTISNNKGARGGAIYCYKTTTLYDGSVIGNYASTYAGAIYMPNSQSTSLILGKIDESTTLNFNGNHSGKSGGAIFGQTLTNFVIYQGVVFDGNYNNDGNGGAINTSGPVLANGVVFKNNVAEGKGGAVYVTYKHPENKVRISEFNDCEFINNSAEYGGAITATSEDSSYVAGAVAYINDCVFEDNDCTKNGGAIYVARKAMLNVYESEFRKNTSSNTEYGGGAIYFTGSFGEFANVTFVENASIYNGGAIAVYSNSQVTISDLIANGNVANKYGGAVYVNGSTVNFVGESIFGENSANNGGANYFTKSTVDAETLIFNKNTATNSGGALYVYTSTIFKVDSLIATENKAEGSGSQYGGVMYLSANTEEGVPPQVTISSIIASDNTVGKGGVIYITTTGTSLTILSGNLKGNTATVAGGGNALYSNAAKVIIMFKGGLNSEVIEFELSDIAGKGSIVDVTEE